MRIRHPLPPELLRLVDAIEKDENNDVDVEVVLHLLEQLVSRVGTDRATLDETAWLASARMTYEAMRRLRAWSEEAAARAEAKPPAQPDIWDAIGGSLWATMLENDVHEAERLATERLLQGAVDALQQPVRRPGGTKVGLSTLVQALEDAYNEARDRELRRDMVAKRRAEIAAQIDERAHSSAHTEDLQEQLGDLRRRLRDAGGSAELRKLARSRADLVALLVAALHLAKNGEITIAQEDFPRGVVVLRQLGSTA